MDSMKAYENLRTRAEKANWRNGYNDARDGVPFTPGTAPAAYADGYKWGTTDKAAGRDALAGLR